MRGILLRPLYILGGLRMADQILSTPENTPHLSSLDLRSLPLNTAKRTQSLQKKIKKYKLYFDISENSKDLTTITTVHFHGLNPLWTHMSLGPHNHPAR
jgi:hypothetical protein